MRCSVIIPCWNGRELTAACLASLLSMDGSEELEILLVDNASSDGTAELAAMDPRIRLLPQRKNLGFAGGVNQGLRAARQPLLMILNNDTRAAPNMLRELVAALASDPRLGAVAPVSNHVKGPALLPVGDSVRDATARAELAALLAGDSSPLLDTSTLSGLCLLLRRETIATVGLFDERFGAGNYEDDDFCLRLRLHGYRLAIARRAFLFHEGHATFRALGLALPEELASRRATFVAKWQQDPAGAALIASWAGDRERAAAAAQRARLLYPRWADADWHLAAAAMANGDDQRAATHLAALLRHSPWHSEAALARARCLLRAGKHEAARAQLTALLLHAALPEQQYRYVAERLAELELQRGDPAAASNCYRLAADTAPADGRLQHLLALSLLQAGDWPAATAACTAAIELGVELAYSHRGVCRLATGDARGAVQDCLRAVELLPTDLTARQNLLALRHALQAGSQPKQAALQLAHPR